MYIYIYIQSITVWLIIRWQHPKLIILPHTVVYSYENYQPVICFNQWRTEEWVFVGLYISNSRGNYCLVKLIMQTIKVLDFEVEFLLIFKVMGSKDKEISKKNHLPIDIRTLNWLTFIEYIF